MADQRIWIAQNLLVWYPIPVGLAPGAPASCEQCGYCLNGLEQTDHPKCPECGEPIRAVLLAGETRTQILRPSMWLRILSLTQFTFAVCAVATPFIGTIVINVIAGGQKLARNQRHLVYDVAQLSEAFAVAGVVLGLGVWIAQPLARRYPGPLRVLGACLVWFVLMTVLLPSIAWT